MPVVNVADEVITGSPCKYRLRSSACIRIVFHRCIDRSQKQFAALKRKTLSNFGLARKMRAWKMPGIPCVWFSSGNILKEVKQIVATKTRKIVSFAKHSMTVDILQWHTLLLVATFIVFDMRLPLIPP
ncbi:hypothetical protein [Rhodopirellula sp. MGV]|uniref:hypothetical protein n=1 Tax=Rhodopirellula sp. MGV TaxID=2023130 RepID=UPI0018E95370|nr:hypothetical protein [Rhodopirellula sp. MGV]